MLIPVSFLSSIPILLYIIVRIWISQEVKPYYEQLKQLNDLIYVKNTSLSQYHKTFNKFDSEIKAYKSLLEQLEKNRKIISDLRAVALNKIK